MKLPDGRLFCVMRTSAGQPVLDRQQRRRPDVEPGPAAAAQRRRRAAAAPAVALPDLRRGRQRAGSGRYALFIHNHDGHYQGYGPTDTSFHRRPVYLVPGRFQPGAEQPVWFDEPRFFMDHAAWAWASPARAGGSTWRSMPASRVRERQAGALVSGPQVLPAGPGDRPGVVPAAAAGKPRSPRRPDAVVARGPLRHVHPLGALCAAGRRVEGPAHAGDRRVDHEQVPHPDRRIRAARRAVQPGEVRRRRLGPPGQAGGHALHGHHLEAPRRLRHVPLGLRPLQHRRCHAVPPRPDPGAGRGLPAPRAEVRRLLLAGPRLARARRRRDRAVAAPERRLHDAGATPGISPTTPRNASSATSRRRSSRSCASC